MATKSIIYYTDSQLAEPIFSIVQKLIHNSGLPIVSASLKPMNFGENIRVDGNPSYATMIKQIVSALEKSKGDFVFFCEHDVLYHKSHFDFLPTNDDVFYYNTNNWRWDYPTDRAINYDGLTSLSQLCVSKITALRHFKTRLIEMEKLGFENFAKDPHLARLWGYEPGRKKKSNGALLEEKSDIWYSDFPNIDIRHNKTFSIPKVKLKDFRIKPTGWREISIDKIPGWDLKYTTNGRSINFNPGKK